jgi:ribosome-associated protein
VQVTAPLPPIAAEALTWRFTRASGPGGQHVNKTSSQVELDCDLSMSGLPDVLIERLTAKLGPVVRVVAADTRSQHRNREIAEQRLMETLQRAAVVPRTRRKTRPGRGAVEERLTEKRKRSERKQGRAWRGDD